MLLLMQYESTGVSFGGVNQMNSRSTNCPVGSAKEGSSKSVDSAASSSPLRGSDGEEAVDDT